MIRNSSPPTRQTVSVLRTQRAEFGDLAQDQVAGGMAVHVVDLLEVIDVETHDRHRALIAIAHRPVFFEPVHRLAAIVQAGQIIGDRQVLQSLIEVHQLFVELPRTRDAGRAVHRRARRAQAGAQARPSVPLR